MSDPVPRELLEKRLKRYLHYASEQPIYKSGDRFYNKCYTKENVPSLIKLFTEENPESIVDIILKVKKDETSLWPDALTFALLLCATQEVSPPLSNAAYKALRTVCKTARDILLFVKFYRELKTKKEVTGGGNGFKRAIAHWYLVWMPFDLADIFLHQKSYHGFKHSDVMKMAHVKPISVEQQLLFTFAMRGLEETKKSFRDSDNEQVKELLEYITSVEAFRRVKTPEEAAKSLAQELHNIERVPTQLLKFQEVWNELIPNMDVKTLLGNLQRLSILGFLKNNNLTVMRVVDVFNNVWKAETFKGHPSRVFIELMKYEKAAKYCLDIAVKMAHPISRVTPVRKPPKCNIVIKNALITFFYSLFKFQKPTGLRYLVAIDLRPKMFSDRCFHCLHLSPIEASTVMCLSLIRTEPDNNVSISHFTEAKGDIKLLSVEKDPEISTFESLLVTRESQSGPASVASAIHWAQIHKKPVDVFLILTNYTVLTSGTKPAITKYRTEMNLPNTKVITCSLSGNVRSHKDVEGQNMLYVIGFDEHTCRLIEAFARGSF